MKTTFLRNVCFPESSMPKNGTCTIRTNQPRLGPSKNVLFLRFSTVHTISFSKCAGNSPAFKIYRFQILPAKMCRFLWTESLSVTCFTVFKMSRHRVNPMSRPRLHCAGATSYPQKEHQSSLQFTLLLLIYNTFAPSIYQPFFCSNVNTLEHQ